jgi:hypothetical protein
LSKLTTEAGVQVRAKVLDGALEGLQLDLLVGGRAVIALAVTVLAVIALTLTAVEPEPKSGAAVVVTFTPAAAAPIPQES